MGAGVKSTIITTSQLFNDFPDHVSKVGPDRAAASAKPGLLGRISDFQSASFFFSKSEEKL